MEDVPAETAPKASKGIINSSTSENKTNHEETITVQNETAASEKKASGIQPRESRGSKHAKVDDPEDIHRKSSEPKPRKSLQTLKEEQRLSLLTFSRPKSKESVLSREKSLSRRSLQTSQAQVAVDRKSRKSSGYAIPIEGRRSNAEQRSLAAPSIISQTGSILSKTYKEKELHVKVNLEAQDEEDFEEWYEEDEDEDEEDEQEWHGRRGTDNRKRSKPPAKSVISFAALNKGNIPTDRELATQAYETVQMKTFADLLIAKARRSLLLDAYCMGRGIIDTPVMIVNPSFPDKFVVHDENILSYSSFLSRLQELEEQISHSLQQIVLVFTASFVSHKKTWSEDCNLIETAVAWMSRYLDADCYVLYIRTGTHAEWKDPTNPFRTDKRLMLKSLPTITVWNTEKRLAGSRLFNLDNIAVLLED